MMESVQGLESVKRCVFTDMHGKAVPKCRDSSGKRSSAKVSSMRSLGRSKTMLLFDFNEYTEQDPC